MDEENKEEKKEEPTTQEGLKEGDKPEGTRLIDDTNLAAKRLEEATKEAREERELAEQNYAKQKLGGTAEAGQAAPKKETETDQQFANNLINKEDNLMFPDKK